MSEIGVIGPRVRAARERLGWTREALAFHAGLSWSAVAQVESGRRTNVRPSTLAALARPLGVSIDYLIDGGLSRPPMLDHSVFPYRTDDDFRAIIAPFLAEGLERSEATLAVATGPNIELLRGELGKDARSVEFVDASCFYSTPIAALETYRAFVDSRLKQGAAWIRVVGQPNWTGTRDAEVRLWTRYESLFNLVFAASPVTVVCAYDTRLVAPEVVSHACATHPSTMDERGISPNPGYTDPGRFALEPEGH